MHPSLRTKPAPLRAVALAVLEAKAADLLDVEYSLEQPRRVVLSAFEAGVPVVLSSHDFRVTPGADEIVASLRQMQGELLEWFEQFLDGADENATVRSRGAGYV
ncbi:type I 3-dehydroquinate dehydratase [Arcanobacterium haemolyticum]|uniref:type I 3-dehydroquinate dehydratase n=1 Tax=Arcanobacterium haemolyticum TaxID=28264 RepID=UPI0009D6B17A|nr:type I 3-dehydroquinate dehydratase [Arcanobacterium haemolyticum]